MDIHKALVGLLLFLSAAIPAQGADGFRFVFDPKHRGDLSADVDIRNVSVAGSFSNWDRNRYPLEKQPDGTFARFIDLPAGIHHYKFVVNGELWIADPAADPGLSEPDNFGGVNSGVVVGEYGPRYGKPAPGGVNSRAVKHDPADLDFFNVVSTRRLDLRIRVLEKDVQAVRLRYRAGPRDDSDWKTQPMKLVSNRFGFDFFGAAVPIPDTAASIRYYFELTDADQTERWPPDPLESRLQPLFQIPEWAKHVVWYQIMPDRFRNGDPENDPSGTLPWTWDWAKPYTEEEKKSSYSTYWSREFGGDLKGLIHSLDYLKTLGIGGIYLNPVFEANGYSKYNTSDYRHIDDNFGVRGDVAKAQAKEGLDPSTWQWTPTDTLFLTFVKEAHARGIKVMLDAVFNHSGEEFWAFKDVVRREKESPYADWFVITDWDAPPKWPGGPAFEYKGWHGFGSLPEYAEDDRGLHAGVRQHLFDITRRWMDPNGDGDPSDGIDGWRLDAADDIDPDFWAQWRILVKQLNPEAFICGEIWGPAPELLKGRHFDALMNYPFAMRAVNFFINTLPGLAVGPAGFQQSLDELLSIYPAQANHAMLNLFASHDVDRLASMIRNPNRPYDRQNRPHENPAYDISRPSDADYRILKLMATFQMTFPGAPLIWYGDEVGMYGADDPADRMPMWWADLMPYGNPEAALRADVLDYYRRLIAIRNTYPALRTGDFSPILTDDGLKIYIYERRDDIHRLIIAINNDKSPHSAVVPVLSDSTGLLNLLDPKSAPIRDGTGKTRTIDLPPKGAAILVEISEPKEP